MRRRVPKGLNKLVFRTNENESNISLETVLFQMQQSKEC